MKTTWQRTAVVAAGEVLFVLLLHWLLRSWLASQQIVATILAAGDHVSRWTIGLAIVFVLVRFTALFLLPGLVLGRLATISFCWWDARTVSRSTVSPETLRQTSPPPDPP